MAGIRDIPGLEVEEIYNPNVKAGGSAEAQAYRAAQTGSPDFGPPRPAGVTGNAAPGRLATIRNGLVGSPQQWGQYLDEIGTRGTTMVDRAKNFASESWNNTGRMMPSEPSTVGRTLGRAAMTAGKWLGPAAGLAEAGTGLVTGDTGRVALGSADAAAGLSLGTPAAPLGATWLAGRTIQGLGQAAVDWAPTKAVDAVGGFVNHIGLRTGLYGNDDSTYLRDKAATNMGVQSPVTGAGASAVASAAQPATSMREWGAEARGGNRFPQADGKPYVREGNSFSDNGQPASGYGVSVLQSDPLAAQRNERAAAIQAQTNKMRQNLRDFGDVNGPVAAGTGLYLPGSQAVDEREARNATVGSTLTKGSPRRLQQLAAQREEMATRRDIAQMTNDTQRGIADAQNKATLRGQDLNYDAQTRGQDMTARTAAASARADQMNKDRQYNLDVAKFGEDQAKTRFDQRTKMVEETTKLVGQMAPAGPDGKPDAAWHAAAVNGLNSIVAARQSALERELQKNPGNADARKELDALEKQGIGVLNQKQIRELTVGMGLRGVAGQSSLLTAGSNSGSTQPVTSLRRKEGMLWDDYESPQGDRIPSWRLKSGGVGPFQWGGDINPDYRDLIRK